MEKKPVSKKPDKTSKQRPVVFGEEAVSHVRIIKPLATKSRNCAFLGKIYLRPKYLQGSRQRAKTVFLKPGYILYKAREHVEILDKLRDVGLPVPKAGIVFCENKMFIAIEAFFKKNNISKLIPINKFPRDPAPSFLKKLNIKTHANLIKNLAKYTAIIYNQGIASRFFDFFGFIKTKDGKLKPVIMDFEHFEKMRPRYNNLHKYMLLSNIKNVKRILEEERPEELALFLEHLKNNLNDELKQAVFPKK